MQSSKKTGHEIVSEILELRNKVDEELESAQGELTAGIEKIMLRLEETELDAKGKLDAYRFVVEGLEEQAQACKSVVEFYNQKAERAGRKVDSLMTEADKVRKRAQSMFEEVFGRDAKVTTDWSKYYLQTYISVSTSGLADEPDNKTIEAGIVTRKELVEKGYGKPHTAYRVGVHDLKKAVKDGVLESLESAGAYEIETVKIRGL